MKKTPFVLPSPLVAGPMQTPETFAKGFNLVISKGTFHKLANGNTLMKAAAPDATEDEDGVLTSLGFQLAEAYAEQWLQGSRDLASETQHPELAGLFYDIRSDAELAHRYGDPG